MFSDKPKDECSDIEGIDLTSRALEGFEAIDKNIFVRATNEVSKHAETIPCDCRYNPTTDPRDQACGENSNCINRLTKVECNPLTCPCGRYCLNRRLQKREYAKVRIIDAGRKGYGMQALEDLAAERLIMEYMGELVTATDFRKRTRVYQSEGIQHHYFMAVDNRNVIDATRKGCIARFINHSCNSNCMLDKWVIGGAVRLGIFTTRPIKRGEEITFDYRFERVADTKPQPCYCGASNCKGIIGATKERSRKGMLDVITDDDADEDIAGFIDEEIEDTTVTRHQRDDIRRRHAAALDDSEYDSDGDVDEYSDSEDDDEGSDSETIGFRHIRSRARQKTKKKGLTSPEQVLKFVQFMHRSARQTRSIEILIGKLMETTDKRLLKSLIGLQGAGLLRMWLQDYEGDDVMMIKILQCIAHMPISTKNTIVESGLEDTVKPLCSYNDENVASLASELIERWSSLRHVFKIPKKTRKRSASATPVPEAPAVSSRHSPNHKDTDSQPVLEHHTQDASGTLLSGKEEGDEERGRGIDTTMPHADSPAPLNWRHSNSQPVNYLSAQMRSVSSSPGQETGVSHGSNGSVAYGANGEGAGFGSNYRAAGYRRYNHSPSDPTRINRPPIRETPYSSYRSRYEQLKPRSRSRTRSPDGLRRIASSYSRFSRFGGNGDFQGSGRTHGQYSSYNNSPLHRESQRDYGSYGGQRPETSPPSSFQRGKYSGWAGHASYRQDGNYRAYDMDIDRNSRGGRPMARPYASNGTQSSDVRLAPGWKTANADNGMVYYYHEVTKETRWEPPLADAEPRDSLDSGMQTNEASYDQHRNLGMAERHRRQYNRPQHGHISSSGHSLMPAEDSRVDGFSKPNVDEIIERALRMGMLSTAPADGAPGASVSSSTPNTQLITPETDGEPITSGGEASADTPGTGGGKVIGNTRKVSASSVSSSSAAATPLAKREKLEKKATSELAAFVVRIMSKYKDQLGHGDFKHEARKVTKILMEKERKAAGFDPQKLIELSQHKKTKIKQFIVDYASRLIDRQQQQPQPTLTRTAVDTVEDSGRSRNGNDSDHA
ncbi:hypothetical protein H4217_004307 [Coemansia sp. RSA 1939]|nr:hypothetical protein H4217_004307 [Coemansia sp. RSA 1939]